MEEEAAGFFDWADLIPYTVGGVFTLLGVSVTFLFTNILNRRAEKRQQKRQQQELLVALGAEVEAIALELFQNVKAFADYHDENRQLPRDADRARIRTPRIVFVSNAGRIGSLGDYDLIGDIIALHAEVGTLDMLAREQVLVPERYDESHNPVMVSRSAFREEAYAAHLFAAAGIADGLIEKFGDERQKLGSRGSAQEQLAQIVPVYRRASVRLKAILDESSAL